MRYHKYNNFLSTQLSLKCIEDILGVESHQLLINHFGEKPAVFEADDALNKEAHDMAMNSFVVCKQKVTYDVIVYTCDGKQPYRRGNYFIKEGRSYLAFTGFVNHDDYNFSSMKTLKDFI
jgi:hypothetical protein